MSEAMVPGKTLPGNRPANDWARATLTSSSSQLRAAATAAMAPVRFDAHRKPQAEVAAQTVLEQRRVIRAPVIRGRGDAGVLPMETLRNLGTGLPVEGTRRRYLPGRSLFRFSGPDQRLFRFRRGRGAKPEPGARRADLLPTRPAEGSRSLQAALPATKSLRSNLWARIAND
jgi:hypothetical protein